MKTTTETKTTTPVLDKWEGPLGFEGKFTGDNRYIEPEGVDVENITYPAPFRWAAEDIGAHDGARVIGSIFGIERFTKPTVRNGETYPVGTLWGWGDFDMKAELGIEAQRHVEEGRTNGVSLDLDRISAEVSDATAMAAAGVDLAESVEDMNITAIRKARSRSATLVALPAFEGARIKAVASWSHTTPASPIADALKVKDHECEGAACAVCAEAKKMALTSSESFTGGIQVDRGGRWGVTVPVKGYRWVDMPDLALSKLQAEVEKAVPEGAGDGDSATRAEALGRIPEIAEQVRDAFDRPNGARIAKAQDAVAEVSENFPWEDYEDLEGVDSESGMPTQGLEKIKDALDGFIAQDPYQIENVLKGSGDGFDADTPDEEIIDIPDGAMDRPLEPSPDEEDAGDTQERRDAEGEITTEVDGETVSAKGPEGIPADEVGAMFPEADEEKPEAQVKAEGEMEEARTRDVPEGWELKDNGDGVFPQYTRELPDGSTLEVSTRTDRKGQGYATRIVDGKPDFKTEIGGVGGDRKDSAITPDEIEAAYQEMLGKIDGDGDGKTEEVENETTEADFPGLDEGIQIGDTVQINGTSSPQKVTSEPTRNGVGDGWYIETEDGRHDFLDEYPGSVSKVENEPEADAGNEPASEGADKPEEIEDYNTWNRAVEDALRAAAKGARGNKIKDIRAALGPLADGEDKRAKNAAAKYNIPIPIYTGPEFEDNEDDFSTRKHGAWRVKSTVLASGAVTEDITSEDFEVVAANALTVANDLREQEGKIPAGTRAAKGYDLETDVDNLIDSIDAVFARRKAGVAELAATFAAAMAIIDINSDWHSPKTGKYIHKPWEFDFNLKGAIPKDRQIQLTSALQTTPAGKDSNVGGDLFYLRKQLRQFQSDPSEARLNNIWDQLADFRNSWSIGSNVLAGMNMLSDHEYEAVDAQLNELEESLEFIEYSMSQREGILPVGVPEVEKKSELGEIDASCFNTGSFASSASCPRDLGVAQADFRGAAINPGNSQEWKFDGASLSNSSGDVVEMRQTSTGDIYAYANVKGQEYFGKSAQDVLDAVESSTDASTYADKHGLKVADKDKTDAGMIVLGTLIPSGIPAALFQEALNAYFSVSGEGSRLKALEEWMAQAGFLDPTRVSPDPEPGFMDDEYYAEDDYFATREERAEKMKAHSLVASGGGTMTLAAPIAPPAAWFDNPNFKTFSPLTVTKEGRVFGHLALWGTCHAALGGPAGNCIMVPSSKTNYELFHLGAVETAEGHDVFTGPLTMNTGHADDTFGARKALAHYENTGLAIADVRVGEDQFGVYVTGALRPDATPAQIRALKASPISGDWRRHAPTDSLELRAALAVNMPGYAVPRPKFMVASGAVQSLTAAGMVPPATVSKEKVEAAMAGDTLALADIRYLKNLLARERSAEAAQLRHQVLLATGAPERVDAMAAMIAEQNRTRDAEKLEEITASARALGLVKADPEPEGEADEDQLPLFVTTRPYTTTLK